MKILVTGADGFIGKNLCAELENRNRGINVQKTNDNDVSRVPYKILPYDIDTDPADLDHFCKEADFVFHLAGVNRPEDPAEFMRGNFGFTSELLAALKRQGNCCPVMLSSSIQAALDNPYGQSKRAGEELLFNYGKETGAEVLIYRFPNVFGKWCRPNYNSAVATFCYNLTRDLPITVNDRNAEISLVYIDDVVAELVRALDGEEHRDSCKISTGMKATTDTAQYCMVPTFYTETLGKIVDLLYTFRKERKSLKIPDLADSFTRKLYSTWLSYLPEDNFSYLLNTHADQRGSFTEFLKSDGCGQVSVNISKPGIVKGNHWHHTKVEKYLVVSGMGVIRFRKIGSEQITEYHVSGDKMEVVDIPAGYTHNIENLGNSDMVTIMWANECFDPETPDTYFVEV